MMDAEIILLNKLLDSLLKKLEKDSQKDSIITTKPQPHKLSRTTQKKITTNHTKKPTDPSYSLVNPLRKDTTLQSLDTVLGDSFLTKGMLLIKLGKQTIFENDTKGDFEDTKAIQTDVDGGIEISRDESLEFFLWNEEDNTELKITVIARFGD